MSTSPTPPQLRNGQYLATIFGRPFVVRLLDEGAEELRRVLSVAHPSLPAATVQQAYEQVYHLLSKEYRCEYVYKNAIANKILLGRHSPRTTTLLQEVPIETSQADLVVVNGHATVYEIKTELDSLRRLGGQLDSYQRAFEQVMIVTDSKEATNLADVLPREIGVMALTSRYTLRQVRRPVACRDHLEPRVMFDILRREEFKAIVREHFGVTPDVPNTRIYTECRALFLQLPVDTAYRAFVRALRSRRPWSLNSAQLSQLPHSLALHGLAGTLRPHNLSALEKDLPSPH